MTIKTYLILGLSFLSLGLVMLLGSALWALIAEATNHGYPHPGVLTVVGFLGAFSIIGSIPLLMTYSDLKKGRD